MINELQKLFDNDAAQSSPIYNPPVDSDILEVYEMMEEPTPEVMAEYTTVFNTMTTVNPFAGVIINPNACDISENITDLNEVKALVDEIHLLVQQTGTSTEVYDWQQAVPGIHSDLDEGLITMDEMMQHTDRVVANLPTIVSMAQNQAGIENAMSQVNSLGGLAGVANALSGLAGAAGVLGACFPVQGFLGSIMSRGKALLNGVKTFVNSLKDNLTQAINEVKNQVLGQIGSAFQSIQDILNSVKDVMAQVMGQINAIKDMIKQEIAKLVGSMLGMMRIGLLQMIKNLLNDPCLKGLVGAVTGGGVAGKLGG